MRFNTVVGGFIALVALPLGSALSLIQNEGLSVSVDLVIPDTYIVKYKAAVNAASKKEHEDTVDGNCKKHKKRGILHTFDILGLQGYVAEISALELVELLVSDLIEYVEKDTIVRTAAVAANPSLHHDAVAKRTMVTQDNAPWGLARISHRGRGYTDYFYSDTAGEGVRVYVLDTGINVAHADFGGRAVWGANFAGSSPDADEDGHGTHVAGIVAGETHGVAKKAVVVAVKVLDRDGSGSMSDLLRALEWAVRDADTERAGAGPGSSAQTAVINMSLIGAYTRSVNEGVEAATRRGITVVVAAGNDEDDVRNWSPASAPSAITVAAIDQRDFRPDFSNWGKGVDIFAPGVWIPSAYKGGDSASAVLSGTSMAAPHVAGLAAYFIAREGINGSAAVTERILSASIKGVGKRNGSPNRIAYNDHGR
ncbi:subtilisin-like protein [Parathielavia hyrcaniae]|uniref:Subtilisin-like protein n=1 Tax=Parathielavia hyrcaniae TaxID=113614 RepID=A0AAN6T209_9PEZI|nr:subtilisin-like protein [Parathielavia hyrcaniae]